MPTEPTNKPEPPIVNWSDKDASLLRSFLDASPMFFAALRAKRPKITQTETMEARAMSGSEIKGAEHMLEAIRELAIVADSIREASPFIGREAE